MQDSPRPHHQSPGATQKAPVIPPWPGRPPPARLPPTLQIPSPPRMMTSVFSACILRILAFVRILRTRHATPRTPRRTPWTTGPFPSLRRAGLATTPRTPRTPRTPGTPRTPWTSAAPASEPSLSSQQDSGLWTPVSTLLMSRRIRLFCKPWMYAAWAALASGTTMYSVVSSPVSPVSSVEGKRTEPVSIVGENPLRASSRSSCCIRLWSCLMLRTSAAALRSAPRWVPGRACSCPAGYHLADASCIRWCEPCH